MKKIFSILFVIVFFLNAGAQKMYATQSAQIKINLGTATESLLGVNDHAESRWLESNGQIMFTARIRDFIFENRRLGAQISESNLEMDKFPKADFKGFINDIQHIDLTTAGGNEFSADGNLTIHGVTKKMLVNGSLTVLSSGKIMLKSELNIKLKDFNIKSMEIGNQVVTEARISVYCIYE